MIVLFRAVACAWRRPCPIWAPARGAAQEADGGVWPLIPYRDAVSGVRAIAGACHAPPAVWVSAFATGRILRRPRGGRARR